MLMIINIQIMIAAQKLVYLIGSSFNQFVWNETDLISREKYV